MIEKPTTKRDAFALNSARSQPCVACGSSPADPAHIRSRGAGGPDEPWNLLSLCRNCHIYQHRSGWKKFSEVFPKVWERLVILGWDIYPTGKLYHPLLVAVPKS